MGSEYNLISPSTYNIVFVSLLSNYIKIVMIYKIESHFIHVWYVDETMQ